MSTIDESKEVKLNSTTIDPARQARIGRQIHFDERGHAIPLTEAEMAEYREEALLALEAMASIPDDPDESDEEFWRAIDEGRPERPLFKEFYKS